MLFGFYFFSFDQVLLLGKDFSSLSYMLLLMKIYVFFFFLIKKMNYGKLRRVGQWQT